MNTNVIFIDEQVHWLYQLSPSHIKASPQSIFSLDGKDFLKTPSNMWSEVFRPRNLSSTDNRGGVVMNSKDPSISSLLDRPHLQSSHDGVLPSDPVIPTRIHATHYSMYFVDPIQSYVQVDLSRYSNISFKIQCDPKNVLLFVLFSFDDKVTDLNNMSTRRVSSTAFSCDKHWSDVSIDFDSLDTPH